jgi:hypothetical protein
MYSILEIVFFFLLIIGAGIAGVVLIVTGILNKNTKRWTIGSVIVTFTVILTALMIGRGISSYYRELNHLIEIQHQCDEDLLLPNESIDNSLFFNNTDFIFLNSCITESDSLYFDSLFSFNIYIDDSLLKKGFYVSNAMFHDNQTYQFTIRSEYPLNSNIEVFAIDNELQELFKTEMRIVLSAGQSTICVIKSTEGGEIIPVSFLFRII